MGVAEPRTVILDRYRLDALIGEGGMAGVWRAWDLTLQRPVAVKLLFARDARDEAVLVDRFLREARIAAAVQHRNVIHIVDFGTTPENQPFMVMELLEGETLAARLRREKRLSVADTVQIANLTLRGLGAVHSAGIIHRDLKPDNVYLKAEAGVVYPKILDFGISRSIEPASGTRSALTTRDGVIVGTPEFMSPEQARGMKRIDYRTDLYSMGVLLYETLTGRLPYRSENVGDLIIKIVTGVAPRVHELVPEVPVPVSEVVARAMARNPSDRFADTNAMQEALLEAVTRSLGGRTMHALSDLPPQNAQLSIPLYLRPTRRPPTGMLRTPAGLGPDPRPTTPIPAPNAAGLAVPDAASVPNEQPANEQALPESDLTPSEQPGRASASSLAPTLTVAERLADWQQRWFLPLSAAGAITVFGVLVLWLAPSAPPQPPRMPRATKHLTAQPPALPIEHVTLTLRGVPPQATVTLDGAPALATLQLPRGSETHSIVVIANGKAPWHASYVPNADQQLDVALKDAPQPAIKPSHRAKRPKRAHRAPAALREPDF